MLRQVVIPLCAAAFRVAAQAPDPFARLGTLIAGTQRAHIRESYGELAGECFTWDDLGRFRRASKPRVLASALRASPEVHGVVAYFRGRTIGEVRAVLEPLRKAARPTWAQLGRISRDGQTDAGNQAEREIANAVVDMVLALVSGDSR